MIDYYCNHIQAGNVVQLIDLDQNTKELGTVRKEFKIEKNPVNGETVFTLNNQYEPLTKLLKLLEYNQVLVIKKEEE